MRIAAMIYVVAGAIACGATLAADGTTSSKVVLQSDGSAPGALDRKNGLRERARRGIEERPVRPEAAASGRVVVIERNDAGTYRPNAASREIDRLERHQITEDVLKRLGDDAADVEIGLPIRAEPSSVGAAAEIERAQNARLRGEIRGRIGDADRISVGP